MPARDTTFTRLELTATDGACDDVSLQMDESSFRGFYDRTARPLWAYLYRATGDRHAADDLLQESYYRLLRAGTTLETETHRRHYLFRVATNLVTDRHRRARTRPAGTGDDPDAFADPASADTLHRRLDLRAALGRLRVRERALLWLAYGQGASHQEIAQAMGVGVPSVKALLFRARRRLATLLGEEGDTGGLR